MGADEGNQNYGALNMIKNYYPPYTTGVIYTVIVLGLIIAAVVIPGFVKGKSLVLSVIKWGFTLAVLAVVMYMAIKDKEDNILSLYLFTGVTIITGILILLNPLIDKNIKVLMLAGCYMVAVYPFGSSSGLYTVGINTFWIAFPVAINHWFSRQTLGRQPFVINAEQTKWIRSFGVLMLIFTCLIHAYFYPYFDRKNRLEMTHSIDNKHLKGIFTSEERAASFNQLLTESEKYVKPNDYVLAYDCMPMYYYVTETRPYIRNSWPYLYQKELFKNELQKAQERTKILPVVVMQNIKTIGSGSDWPTEPLKYDTEWAERNKGRNDYLQAFLDSNQYKTAWTNGVFKILVARKDSLVKMDGAFKILIAGRDSL
jgi:heme/copper-type cytochrome/quinol oxidase subunit 4